MFLCVLPALLAWDSSPGAPAALRAAALCRGGRTGISGPGPEPRIGTENIILAVLDPTVYGDAAAPESLARYLRRLAAALRSKPAATSPPLAYVAMPPTVCPSEPQMRARHQVGSQRQPPSSRQPQTGPTMSTCRPKAGSPPPRLVALL